MENLGEKIKKQREAKHMSVEDLSKKTYLSIAVIKDIEAGKFDLYEGDETYVKMYLKKISEVLELDTFELTQSYYELTQEIKLNQIKEKEELEKKQNDMIKKGKTFHYETPKYTRKKSVYEKKSHIHIIRVGIVFLLIALIFGITWWGISKTKSNVSDPTFNPQNQPTIEGDVLDEQTQENTPANNDDLFSKDVQFVKNDKLDYSFTIKNNPDKFIFKVVFGSKSWASLKVNGSTYNDFKEDIYEKNDVVEVELNSDEFESLDLKNGYSMGHKYYINDVEIPLSEDEYSESVSHLKLNKVNNNESTQ